MSGGNKFPTLQKENNRLTSKNQDLQSQIIFLRKEIRRKDERINLLQIDLIEQCKKVHEYKTMYGPLEETY